jgi:hypothetical protein
MSSYTISDAIKLTDTINTNNYVFTINNNSLNIYSSLTSNAFILDPNSNITTNAYFNGVLAESHASRHQPGGLDPIPTAAAVNVVNSVSAVGVATSLARSDHIHAHSALAGGNLHLTANSSTSGFMSSTDKGQFSNATTLATANTLALRDPSDASSSFSNIIIKENTSNLFITLNTSPNISANYSIILPIDTGTSNQILLNQTNSQSVWSNSPWPNLTQRGDMIVRGTSNLEVLSVPQPPISNGANINYLLETNTNAFPTWRFPPFDVKTGYSELTDFTGSTAPFSETNWRTSVTTSTVVADSFPLSNIGNPIGVVAMSVNVTGATILLTKGTASGTNTMSFAANSTVFFEVATSTENFNATAGSTIVYDLGFGNARAFNVPATQFVMFRYPGATGSGSTSPLQFLTSNGSGTTTQNLANIAANTWVKLKFIVYGQTRLDAYINDVLTYTQTPLTNFPAETTRLSPFINFRRAGSVNKNAFVDYIHWGQFFNGTGRYP